MLDMDGTLVDSEPLWQESERHLMAPYGVPWGREEELFTHGRSMQFVTNYMADLVQQSGAPRPDPDSFRSGFEEYMLANVGERGVVQPGVPELLTSIRQTGLPTALVSSSPRPLMEAVLDKIGRDWVGVTVSANDVTEFKPEPEPYLQAARELGVDPAWCVVVEDSPTGLASATAAGAYVVGLELAVTFDPAPRRRLIRTLQGVTATTLMEWFEPPAKA